MAREGDEFIEIPLTVGEYANVMKRGPGKQMPRKFNGWYRHILKRTPFCGEIVFRGDREFAGILHDPHAMCKEHAVVGEVSTENGSIIMEFVKIPTGSFDPIYYRLTKPTETDSIHGKYDGTWTTLEKGVKKSIFLHYFFFPGAYPHKDALSKIAKSPSKTNKASLVLSPHIAFMEQKSL